MLSPARPNIVIKRFKARQGVRAKLPKTLQELINLGRPMLKIDAIKAREAKTEAEILDVETITENTMIVLTTAEEEMEIEGLL